MCTLVDILASCFFPAMWELRFLMPKIVISQIRQRMFSVPDSFRTWVITIISSR